MKIRTENPARLAAAALSAVTMIAVATPASAQFTSDQLKCRQTIAKETAKLAKTVGKVLVGCHKSQQKEKFLPSVDCNVVSVDSDPKGKVSKTVGKMTDKISDPTKGKCTGQAPVFMGYHQCPAPCDIAVPTIGDASDIAACMACLAQSEVEAMIAVSEASPTPPLGKDDAKCHGAIGKNQTKHLDTALKERPKCQNAAEKAGATTLDPACQGPITKIDDTRTKSEAKVTKSCAPPVDLNNLGSCSVVDVPSLNTCLFDDSAAVGSSLFEAMYGIGDPTWTSVQALFTATGCMSGFCHGNAPGGGQLGNLDDFDLGHDELLVEGTFCGSSLVPARVVAGDPNSSFLVHKLAGTMDCGSLMPFAGTPYTPEQLAIVVDWISAGALKN